ncbi:putative sensor domain DACNV-containing protein [Corallococcus carmarthensis]|uniref:putative sensor domain DACNV-containing protein n=1 Tax=Corallococcus carmarthensis TaxID=2316728 RepID=UPI0011C3C020|nr:hypothetical protein [Corallococcus carmarthensis]
MSTHQRWFGIVNELEGLAIHGPALFAVSNHTSANQFEPDLLGHVVLAATMTATEAPPPTLHSVASANHFTRTPNQRRFHNQQAHNASRRAQRAKSKTSHRQHATRNDTSAPATQNMNSILYPRDHLQEALKLRAPTWLKQPDLVKALGDILDLLFFASLSTEEGESIRVQVAIPTGHTIEDIFDTSEFRDPGEPPQHAWLPIPIIPQPLNIDTLIKLSMATSFGRTSLVITPDESAGLQITGIARRNPKTNGGDALRISASAPGALSLVFGDTEIMRYERGQLANPAPNIFYTDGLVRQAIRSSLKNLLADVKDQILMPGYIGDRVFDRLVRGMSATGRGGLILVHPQTALDHDTEPPKYGLSDPNILASKIHSYFGTSKTWLNTVFREEDEESSEERARAHNERVLAESIVDEITDDVSRLTAMDGALLLGPDLQIFGAGFKVSKSYTFPLYEVFDVTGQSVAPEAYSLDTHGTRHRAAAAFVTATGGLAFIASQDGPLKCLLNDGNRILFWKIRFPDA